MTGLVDELAAAQARAEEALAEQRSARALAQNAEVRLLETKAAWLRALTEHGAAEQRLGEATLTAQRACNTVAYLRLVRPKEAV